MRLGGNCRTTMICTVAPVMDAFQVWGREGGKGGGGEAGWQLPHHYDLHGCSGHGRIPGWGRGEGGGGVRLGGNCRTTMMGAGGRGYCFPGVGVWRGDEWDYTNSTHRQLFSLTSLNCDPLPPPPSTGVPEHA